MNTLSPSQTRLTVDIARQIVARLAPGEMELFAIYAAAFEQDPSGFDRALKSGKAADVLGFDANKVAELALTGLILPVVKEVVLEIRKTQQEKRQSEGLAISQDDLDTIRRRAYQIARKTPMTGEQAAELSNSIVEVIMHKSVPLDSKEAT